MNSWNRRNYITSDPSNPAVGIVIPPTHNEWRRNLILGRDFHGIADLNGDAIRNDDGASFYTHSKNVIYAPRNPGVQFNGGTDIFSVGNLYLQTGSGWLLASIPDVAGIHNDTIVDALPHGLFGGACGGFFSNSPQAKSKNAKPGIYNGNWNLGVFNSTGDGKGTEIADHFFCGESLSRWQGRLVSKGQDEDSGTCTNANGECSSARWLSQARQMLWADNPLILSSIVSAAATAARSHAPVSANLIGSVGDNAAAVVAARTYYINPAGNDAASGVAPTTAWRSVSRVNAEPLRPGDTVLFLRGGTWRGASLHGQAGVAGQPVTYGAYGQPGLPKPVFIGSVSASAPADWEPAHAAPSGTWVANVTRLQAATYPAGVDPTLITDVGNIILGGEKAAARKVWSKSELLEQDQYYFNFTAHGTAVEGVGMQHSPSTQLFFFSPAGNPAAVHGVLECALMTVDHAVIKSEGVSHVIYDSLAIKYGGADGMYLGNASHVTISKLEVSWIGGGCLQAGPRFTRDPKECTRFGNGIEFSDWSAGAITENNVVEKTRLWEIYDAALSPQGGGKYTPGKPMYTQRNLSFHHNIIGHSEYCFEIWSQGNTVACEMQQVRFDNNLCLDSGGGWSHSVRPDPSGRGICSFDNSCQVDNISYRNNIFYFSKPFEAGWWMLDKWGRLPCRQGTCGWKGLVLADHNLWFTTNSSLGPLVKIGEGATSLQFFANNFSAMAALTGSGNGSIISKDPRLRGLLDGGELSADTDVHPSVGSPALGAGVWVGWSTDFEGNPIPNTTDGVDIGPYQRLRQLKSDDAVRQVTTSAAVASSSFSAMWTLGNTSFACPTTTTVDLASLGLRGSWGADNANSRLYKLFTVSDGLWPVLPGDGPAWTHGRALNGGVPAAANLTLHLERVAKSVAETPVQWAGLGVWDFETWLPLWEMNDQPR